MSDINSSSANPARDEHHLRLALTAIVGALLFVAVFALGTPAANAAQPIKIGVIAPMKTTVGKGMLHGAEMAVDDINKAGGVNGRELKLVHFDSNLSATNAVRAWQKAVNKDHVVAGTGVFVSEVALALEPWVGRLKVPFIDTGSASPKVNRQIHNNYSGLKYYFNANLDSPELAQMVCDVLHDTLGKKYQVKNAVILAEDYAWTKAVVSAYKKCLPKVGINVVKTIRSAKSTVDFSPIYYKIKHLKPQPQIIVTAFAHAGLRPVIQWHRGRVPALMVGVNAQATDSAFWSATNGATEGVVSTNSGSAVGVPTTKQTPAFYKAYVKRFHDQPPFGAYTTYDSVHMIAQAIKEKHSTKADALVSAFQSMSYVGVGGTYEFYGKGSPLAHRVKYGPKYVPGIAVQWQDGKQVAIWPADVAQGSIVLPDFVQPVFKKQ